MDILGRESVAFDDHTNVHLVAGLGTPPESVMSSKEIDSPGDGGTAAEDS
jgi:hypothetical protein